METNKVLQSQKEDNERNAKLAEQEQDRNELLVARQTRQEYVASSDMLKYW